MTDKIFKSGDIAPVSGNYRFLKHEKNVPDCVPRYGVYLHLMKGMKLPLHDMCMQTAVYRLMTITNEQDDPNIKGM